MKWAKRIQKYVNYENVAQAVASNEFDVVQPKLDGWWACAVIKNGIASIYSRQGVLKDELPAGGAPPCLLVGEYLVGTQRAVTSKASDRLAVFDVLQIGKSELWNHSYEFRMGKFHDKVRGKAPWIDFVLTIPVRSAQAAWNEFVEKGGAEGLVFRHTRHQYEPGVIGRVKKTFTMDYVVMDVLPGEGKHKSRMGALVCGLYEGRKLVEKVRVGGGWTDQERESIWRRPKSYIGRVLEVRGWQVFASGSMRHPNAVRFRDDKTARECVFTGEAR